MWANKGIGIVGATLSLIVMTPFTPRAASPAAGQQPANAPDKPTFSVNVDLVTTDLVARDNKGNFVSDLTRDEFEVFEDGVKQDIVSITLSHGGRVTNVLAPPPAAAPEGIILPPPKRVNDISGRIFVFFIDDLHLQFQNGPRVKALLKKMSTTLLHEGDMFGIVSSGTSSISVQLTYDKKRFDDIIDKVSGDELKPSEIINGPEGTGGPAEVRHRIRVALDTVSELLKNLEKIHDRRKSLVWISDGYDMIPFQDARLGLMNANSPFLMNDQQRTQLQEGVSSNSTQVSPGCGPSTPSGDFSDDQTKEEFADADMGIQMSQMTLTANRANTTIYTVDPRGLVGSGDLVDEPVEPHQWSLYIQKSQGTLRELAEDTGGIAIVNMNDFDGGLKRIDADSSDYYMLGYYSNNPDPRRRYRKISVRTTRKDVDIMARKDYMFKPAVKPGAEPPASTVPNPRSKK
jgi:VWFA-related protein